MSSTLKEKTQRGVAWNTIDRVANYGITFIVGIVLARLLSPDEYGLIGIVGIFTAIFNIILDSGLSIALIRKDKVTDIDYCTVFYTNLFLSILLTGILFFCAPIISSFFERPELTPYTRAMSFILIINALSITQQARLTKRIDFKTQTKISLIAHILSGIIGIVMALLKYSVWALVAQQLSSRIFTTLLLWLYNKWYPKLIFSLNSFRKLWAFSWKLLVAQLIGSIWNQIYQVVIGKVYSPATLGQYTRAQQYTHLCSSTIGDVVLKVSLPVMSEIQNNDERLLRAFRTIIRSTTLVSAVLTLGMAACSKSLIIVLIGEKWMECVPMMQILCFSFMIYPMQQVNINMLIVQGRSDIQLILMIVKCVLAIIPILLGIFCGVYWMLLGSVINGWISLLLNAYYSGKKFKYSCWNQLRDVMPSFLIAIFVGLPIYALSYIPCSPYLMLPLQILLGTIITILICEKLQTEEYKTIKAMVLSMLNKKQKYGKTKG